MAAFLGACSMVEALEDSVSRQEFVRIARSVVKRLLSTPGRCPCSAASPVFYDGARWWVSYDSWLFIRP